MRAARAPAGGAAARHVRASRRVRRRLGGARADRGAQAAREDRRRLRASRAAADLRHRRTATRAGGCPRSPTWRWSARRRCRRSGPPSATPPGSRSTTCPELALDHATIVDDGLWRLHARVADKVWFVRKALALLTEPFTLRQAQQLYEALRGEEVDAANFRRDVRATGLLEDTGSLRSEGPGPARPSVPARLTTPRIRQARRQGASELGVPVRSILLAFALVLVLPASALAAGTLTVSISGAGGVSGSGIECTRAPVVDYTGVVLARARAAGRDARPPRPPPGSASTAGRAPARAPRRRARWTWPATATVTAEFLDVQDPVVTIDVAARRRAVQGTAAARPRPSTDNGVIERVEFKVGDAAELARRRGARTRPLIPTAMFPDGSGPITATAFDKAGNSHTTTVERHLRQHRAGRRRARPGPRALRARLDADLDASRAEDATSGIAATACSVVPPGAARVIVPCSGGGSHSVSGLPEGRYEFAFGARTPPATTPRPCASSGSRRRRPRRRVADGDLAALRRACRQRARGRPPRRRPAGRPRPADRASRSASATPR